MARPLPCPNPCNVLLIGGGGREHALAWKLRQSDRLGELWITDENNAGLNRFGKVCPQAMDLADTFRMRRWCETNDIHLVIVGPEAPLAAGIVDVLETDERKVFGPRKDAAQIEADKAFAKDIMRQAAIPTAEGRTFQTADRARAYVEAHDEPMVIKAAGLAAGKGVIVCADADEALAAIDRIMVDQEFGKAGERIVIEERLRGQELSILALVDGRDFWILDPCQDHKQLGEGDVGPNTGGMGAYCPTPLASEELMEQVEREVLVPLVDALKRQGIPYRGVLYAGLMLTAAGPKVLEFNCRFGDPETQPLMARLKGDLVELCWAVCTGQLSEVDLEFDPRTACTVVMASGGYPGAYPKGKVITGLDEVDAMDDVVVFHAGTRREKNGDLVTNGGRVLAVTALGEDLQAARDRANEACDLIRFDGAYFRRDIGDRVLVNAKG